MTPDEHQRERMLTWRGAFQMSDLGAQSSAVHRNSRQAARQQGDSPLALGRAVTGSSRRGRGTGDAGLRVGAQTLTPWLTAAVTQTPAPPAPTTRS